MTSDPPSHPDDRGGTTAGRRIIGVVATVALAAGVIWKFIWPWTGWRTDTIFLCITVIGLIAGAVVAKIR